MSSLRGTNPSSEDSSYPPTPIFTSGEQSSSRQSWELRRARSESILPNHRRGNGEASPFPNDGICVTFVVVRVI